ncbi:hypothetical protein [Providencia alcalifaciens]|uniref:hypothetical protein n=1 Tax=Providencia alcalifaciens TaxID=126385 RepID=UPI001CC512BA|nr:hypothetical protein NVI2019_PLFLNFOB_03962 [Providencia alcalifaciens]CAG9435842.1 hypothetical protein NVI2019_ANGEOOBF_03963 [Providencia alcalifaciens]CAG9435844.1 hypothetical protein NVI2019_OGMBKCAO_03967 [Providencia alcalifaciens]CAG9435847.1 hypothetical protein NVI2019_KOLGMIGM_03964 [Providencia alcalifaciens]CAG9437295.1 hypothetical protein NVI2019_OHEONHNH_03962 [Providencia alcalifaciens]
MFTIRSASAANYSTILNKLSSVQSQYNKANLEQTIFNKNQIIKVRAANAGEIKPRIMDRIQNTHTNRHNLINTKTTNFQEHIKSVTYHQPLPNTLTLIQPGIIQARVNKLGLSAINKEKNIEVHNKVLNQQSTINNQQSTINNQQKHNESQIKLTTGEIKKVDIPLNNTTVHKTGLLVFLGNKNIGNQTINIIGQQIPRILQNKNAYDLLVMNDNIKNEFNTNKKRYVIESLNNEALKSKNTHEAIGAAISHAVKTTKTLTPDEININQYKKIYILGHGSAGDNYITCGDEDISHKEIVSRLNKLGLLNLKDIRLTSCYSGDSDKFTTSNKTIDANPPKNKSLFTRVVDELNNNGFKNINVTAYHGAGVFVSEKGGVPKTHLRAISKASNTEESFRRSDYKISTKTTGTKNR